jgi:hypothetical protein
VLVGPAFTKKNHDISKKSRFDDTNSENNVAENAEEEFGRLDLETVDSHRQVIKQNFFNEFGQ